MGDPTRKHQKHIPLTAQTPSKILYNGSGTVTTISVRESTGAAAAAFELYDGSNTTGYPIFECSLTQGLAQTSSFGSYGLEFNGGLYFNLVSGTIVGGVTWVLADDWDEYRSIPLVVNVPFDELATYLAAP